MEAPRLPAAIRSLESLGGENPEVVSCKESRALRARGLIAYGVRGEGVGGPGGLRQRRERDDTRGVKKGTKGAARVTVNAPVERLYDLVSDVTHMGQWSPETIRCQWIQGASGPVPGARFKGTNKRGPVRWTTKPTVVVAERGREFAFETRDTRWSYRFQPVEGGTELIESFELTRDEPAVITFASRYLLQIKDRKADLERAMHQTLERIKVAAEESS